MRIELGNKKKKDRFVDGIKKEGFRLDRHLSDPVGSYGRAWLTYTKGRKMVEISWSYMVPLTKRKYWADTD